MYRKSRRAIVLQHKRERCAAMRAAKERKRLANTPEKWERVFTLLVIGHAAPDGRTLALQVHNCKTWYRCGSVRAVRGALARMMWGKCARQECRGTVTEEKTRSARNECRGTERKP
jgi:hypothetical protein